MSAKTLEKVGEKANEPKNTRRQILETAARLFFRDGYRAVGVDTIVAESGVAKMTLYRHFPSKDDLIVAYLQDDEAFFWQWLETQNAGVEDDPRVRLSMFFKGLAELVRTPTCYGCPSLNAASEFPDHNHPGHEAARAFKVRLHSYLAELAERAGAAQPKILANQLMLLIDGAFMAVRMYGPENHAGDVAAAAETLIHAQLAR